MQYWGVSLNWFDWLQLVLAVIAVSLGLFVLVPAAIQSYLDYFSKWPYETPYIGRVKDPAGAWSIVLAFRFENHTTHEAFFEIGYSLPGDEGRFHPAHISVWPTQDPQGLWVTVPPKASREVRVSPFRPGQDPPKNWTLSIREYRHQNKPVELHWPGELERLAPGVATDIPRATH